jgi:hypothetical protein
MSAANGSPGSPPGGSTPTAPLGTGVTITRNEFSHHGTTVTVGTANAPAKKAASFIKQGDDDFLLPFANGSRKFLNEDENSKIEFLARILLLPRCTK